MKYKVEFEINTPKQSKIKETDVKEWIESHVCGGIMEEDNKLYYADFRGENLVVVKLG